MRYAGNLKELKVWFLTVDITLFTKLEMVLFPFSEEYLNKYGFFILPATVVVFKNALHHCSSYGLFLILTELI